MEYITRSVENVIKHSAETFNAVLATGARMKEFMT